MQTNLRQKVTRQKLRKLLSVLMMSTSRWALKMKIIRLSALMSTWRKRLLNTLTRKLNLRRLTGAAKRLN